MHPSAQILHHPARRLVAVAVALAFCTATVTAGASPSARAADVASAEQALAQARAVRVEAERRLTELEARRAQIDAELQRLDAGAAQITEDLAEASRAVREYAVAAYIDGGQSELLASAMSPGEGASLAWRSQLVGGQTVSAAEAVERLSALRAANDPDRVAAAGQLDHVGSEIEQATSDALQAAALERDAESALAAAHTEEAAAASAAQKAAADTAAAQKAAAQKAAAQKAPAPKTPAPKAPSAAASPSSGGSGGATAAEAAQLARIRACESHGDYTVVSASGLYRGAYQFDTRTWAAVGGTGDPAAAPPAEQDHRALLLLRERGNRPWPNCA